MADKISLTRSQIDAIANNDLRTIRAIELIIKEANIIIDSFDDNDTAGETNFLVYDIDNATFSRVSVGADDSGGVGYKLLRIPN